MIQTRALAGHFYAFGGLLKMKKRRDMIAKKTKMISLGMTEEQYDKMMELMQIDGYHSRSRFIIHTVLNRGGKRKVFRGTDGELM